MCTPVSATTGPHRDLIVPRICLVQYGQRNFDVSGPAMWNSLPQTVRDTSLSAAGLNNKLKSELFVRAYW